MPDSAKDGAVNAKRALRQGDCGFNSESAVASCTGSGDDGETV